MTLVETLRARFAVFLLAWVWANAALLAAVSISIAAPKTVPIVAAGALLALTTTLAWAVSRTGWQTRQISSVAVTAQVMLLVYLLSGHAYQLEMHLYFFAALAMLSGWLDWRIFASCTVAIAAHHAGLSLLYSDAVFPGGSDGERVLVHAVIVVLQALALSWLVVQLRRALERAEQDEALARDAQHDAEHAQSELAAATRQSELVRSRTLAGVAEEFETQIGAIASDVSASVEALRGSAVQMNAGAKLLKEHCESAARSSHDASSNVVAVTDATGSLASGIGRIEQRVEEAGGIVATATSKVEDVLAKVDRLSSNAQDVGKIVAMISSIAERTNLLALNASIEAARAGESGRGFRVVAQEVKALAEQTATAADEILAKIDAIRQSGGEATGAINAMNLTIAALSDISVAVAAITESQSSATTDIARNIRQAAEQTVAASDNIRFVSHFAVETGEVADFVADSADALAARTEQLDAAVMRFLEQIRAA